MEETFLSDPEVQVGEYIFKIQKCPNTYKDAVMMQAKLLDSVIKEESEEHLTTSDGGDISDNEKDT